MACIKCAGNGIKFRKSATIGNYAVRCNRCNGSGDEPATPWLKFVLTVLALLAFGLFLYY